MAFDFAAAVVVGVKLVLMAMSLVGAIASFVDAEKGIGKEWRTALEMLPDLFMAIGGILCAKPVLVWVIARVFGWFSALGSTPAVAGCMLLGIYSEMTRESKVVCAAIMVCGSFSLGDYLAYASVYQPGILPAVVLGKLVGAAVAIPLAWAIVVPIAKGLGGSDGDRLDAYRPMGQTSQNSSFLPTPKSGAFSPTSSRSCVRSLSVQRMLSQFADDTAGEARSPSACSPGGAI